MRILLSIHRAATLFVAVLLVYLGVTGTLLLLVDLRSYFTHAPKEDPNVAAIWEDLYGPPNFRVMTVPDVSAAPLPVSSDYSAMLGRALESAHAAAPNTAIRYAELRMLDGRPVGQFGTPGGVLSFDAVTGAQLLRRTSRDASEPLPIRKKVKFFHRMTFGLAGYITVPGMVLAVAAAAGLVVLLVTGILIYLPMWKARARSGRSNPVWKSGGWWRSLHRAIAIVMAVFLANLILSGTFLAYDNIVHGMYVIRATRDGAIPLDKAAGANVDVSSPLRDAEIPAMLGATLAAGQTAVPAEAVKVIRLRYYAGMPQGVLVIGAGDQTRQLVFNAVTGKAVGTSEPGYPETGWAVSWQAHQIAKSIHRGDFYGITGSMMTLLSGLSMLYLSVSGIVLYYRKWKQRRSGGRSGLLWV